MRVNVKALISYILLFALLVFMFVFNRRRVILFFIVAMVVYMAIAIYMLRKKFVLPEISLKMTDQTQIVGDNNTCYCTIKYDSYFPFSKIDVKYEIGHREQDKKFFIENTYNIYHGSKTYDFDIKLDYCGVYEIKLIKVQFYDLLGIFSRKLTYTPDTAAIVMPKFVHLSEEFISRTISEEEEFENDPNSGSDVSEIKELRDYREGDRLSQVHWKLSTKGEDLIVKEYARQAGVCVAIGCDGSFKTLEQETYYYEFLNAIGNDFITNEIYFDLVYFNNAENELISTSINDTYNLTITMQNMFYNLKPVSPLEIEEYFKENTNKSKLFYITCDEVDESAYSIVYNYKGITICSLLQ